MLSLLSVILRHKRAVILFTAAIVALSAVASLVLPPRYQSSCSFMTLGVARDVTALREFFAPLGAFGESYAMFLRAQKNYVIDSFLRSDRVTTQIVRRFGLVEAYGAKNEIDAARKLRRNTRVVIKDEGVILMSVEDRDAARAAGIAEAYLGILDSLILDLAVQNAGETVDFMEREIERLQGEIAVSDSLLVAYLRLHGMYDVNGQVRAMLDVISSVSARLSVVDVERRMRETTMRPGNAALEQTKLEWNKLREQLVALRDEGPEPALFPSFRKLPEITAGYVNLMSRRRVQEFVLAYLRVRLADARIVAGSRVTTLRVIDRPVAPERRSWPKRKQIVLFSAVAGFLWVSLGVLVRERLRDGTLSLRAGGGAAG